jgi:ABC-type dipeptide/oligopeptide/nickel transport system ATPase component
MQILRLLSDLRAELGLAVIMITHDLGVVAQTCDRIAVMYAGRLCEVGGKREVLAGRCIPIPAGLSTASRSAKAGGEVDDSSTASRRSPTIFHQAAAFTHAATAPMRLVCQPSLLTGRIATVMRRPVITCCRRSSGGRNNGAYSLAAAGGR